MRGKKRSKGLAAKAGRRDFLKDTLRLSVFAATLGTGLGVDVSRAIAQGQLKGMTTKPVRVPSAQMKIGKMPGASPQMKIGKMPGASPQMKFGPGASPQMKFGRSPSLQLKTVPRPPGQPKVAPGTSDVGKRKLAKPPGAAATYKDTPALTGKFEKDERPAPGESKQFKQ